MDIQQRINGLAIFDIGWVTWLIAGFAVGGVAMLLQRAICLVLCRLSDDVTPWDAGVSDGEDQARPRFVSTAKAADDLACAVLAR